MFDSSRQSVTVMEVARALNAPQSSTSELLSSLVRRGYLMRERGARVFRPTARVALLGAWVHPALFRRGQLLPMIDALSEQTGLGVSLASMVGIRLKHVHTVGDAPDALTNGAECHLLHSPFGHVLLSTMYSEDVRLLVHRLNAESEADERVRHLDLAEQLREISKRGWAMAEVAPGWSAVVILLPQGLRGEQLALGLVGRTADIEARREELLRSVRQAVANYIGPRVASHNNAPSLPTGAVA